MFILIVCPTTTNFVLIILEYEYCGAMILKAPDNDISYFILQVFGVSAIKLIH